MQLGVTELPASASLYPGPIQMPWWALIIDAPPRPKHCFTLLAHHQFSTWRLNKSVVLGLLINRISEMTEIDEIELALEFSDLGELLVDPDLKSLGFEQAELDRLLGSTGIEDTDEDLGILEPKPEARVSQLGDLWILGDHRLYCGDALDPKSFNILMDGEVAQLGLSDVPYNVNAPSISGCRRCRGHRLRPRRSGSPCLLS